MRIGLLSSLVKAPPLTKGNPGSNIIIYASKPGPKKPHKPTAEVRQHLREMIQAEPE